jgi:SAM-dependent methyltransferase
MAKHTATTVTEQFAAGTGKEESIYSKRFSLREDSTRNRTWQILCSEFLQKYIRPEDTVIDLGAGDGNFITNIKAARRIAVDSSPHVTLLENRGIEVLQIPAHELAAAIPGKADVVFMSNFLEHLTEKKAVLAILEECRKVLKTGGKVIILQPNIRYVGPAYWDYIDHHIALTEHSLAEALSVTGYTIDTMIPRFLPYTAKSKLGKAVGGGDRDWLVRAYLKFPLLWRIFGQQTFVVAHI